jgi:Cu+-exporting ATPase
MADTMIELDVQGMTCEHCAGKVERALGSVAGVAAAKVDLAAGRARVTGPAPLAPAALMAAVRTAGFTPTAFRKL